MTFDEYQKFTVEAAGTQPDVPGAGFVYQTLGLAGETGEVVEKVKKIIRDKHSNLDDESRTALAKELGDVLWYMARLSTELGLTLDEVAKMNIEKLMDRVRRNTVQGAGDER